MLVELAMNLGLLGRNFGKVDSARLARDGRTGGDIGLRFFNVRPVRSL